MQEYGYDRKNAYLWTRSLPANADNAQQDLLIRNCTSQFRCHQQWTEFLSTLDHRHRFFEDCKRKVIFCDTDEQLIEAFRQNACIVIPENVVQGHFEKAATDFIVGPASPIAFGTESTVPNE